MSSNTKRKHGGGILAPNRGVASMSASNRLGQRQQQRNATTWLERMQAIAAKQRNTRL